MIYAAVALSGFGGLLAELVLVRRYGLLLGNTAEASALVIGAYLLGLGIGGLLVPTLRSRVRALPGAGWTYALVALALVASDLLVQRLEPLPWLAGLGLLALTPGIPTVLMGLAFPLVFAGLPPGWRPWHVGALMAANLGGSLVGTALGGNWAIPALGLDASLALAVVAYLAAAAGLGAAARARREAETAPARRIALPPHAGLALQAALAGGLVIGLQLLLLRRLPFFLEGFQPTLSGVLATCLLALTLGSALGTKVLDRLLGARAPAVALLLAALAMNLGLHERLGASIARIPVESDLGLHARIWLGALVAGGPACLLLGTVLPLCVARFADPDVRSAVAGRLFFWQGVGSIGGSLLIGHLLPTLAPRAFFAVAPAVLGVLAILAVARWLRPLPAAAGLVAVAAACALGVSGAGTPLDPEPPLARPLAAHGPGLRFLDHASDSVGTASVVYDRSRHSMVLYTNEFRATETGPFADYMKVLGHLPFLLRDDLTRVSVIAFGTGTTAKSVVAWPRPEEIHLVEISQAVLAMAPHFAGEGPLREPRRPDFLEDPRTQVHVTDGRRFLALRPEGGLDLITIEPLLPYSPGTASLYTREFYALAARALGPRGLMMQWVPTHALPSEYFDSLLATFARSFPASSVWFVDGATLLVGSREPHLPAPDVLARRLAAAPEPARVALHEAGLARPVDLGVALLGTRIADALGDAPTLHDDRPFVEQVGIWKYDGSLRQAHRANHEVLAAVAEAGVDGLLERPPWRRVRLDRVVAAQRLNLASAGIEPLENARAAALRLADAREILPGSVLLHVEETLALRFARAHRMAATGPVTAGRIAAQHLARDAGSAVFQAARALAASGDAHLSDERAAALAVAIDPTFFRSPPFFVAHLAPPTSARSPLEELSELPEGAALARAATGDDPLAVALRAAYRVRSARALLDVLRERPLEPAERAALAVLLDPVLLEGAVAAVRARGGSVADEIAPLWREDLPRPAALAALDPPGRIDPDGSAARSR